MAYGALELNVNLIRIVFMLYSYFILDSCTLKSLLMTHFHLNFVDRQCYNIYEFWQMAEFDIFHTHLFLKRSTNFPLCLHPFYMP